METQEIKILYVRPWTHKGSDGKQEPGFINQEGDPVIGYTYGGRLKNGKGITFTSPNEYQKNSVQNIELKEGWDESRNRIKYSELVES